MIVKVGILVGRDFYLRENIWNGNLVWGCFMQISLDRRRRRGKDFVEEFYSTIRSFVDISASLSFCLVDLGDDGLHREIQPFVEGDCSVSILIHGGEHVFLVLITKGWQAKTELLWSLREDIDEGDKLTLVNLAIPVSICSLESFPVEEIERLAFI